MISITENGNVHYENQTDVDRELLANEKSPKYYYDETVRLAGVAENAQEAAEEAAEAAMTSTPEGYADFVDNLAPAYSSSATYSAGDYVLHESILYKAKADISTAENWTAAHWTEVRTMAEVSDLEEELSDTNKRIVKINSVVFERTTRISTSAYANYYYLDGTGKCVNGGSGSNYRLLKYAVTAGNFIWVRATADTAGVYQFQSSASVPSSLPNNNLIGVPVNVATDTLVLVPAGATYIIISEFRDNTDTGLYNYIDITDSIADLSYLSARESYTYSDAMPGKITLGNNNEMTVTEAQNAKYLKISMENVRVINTLALAYWSSGVKYGFWDEDLIYISGDTTTTGAQSLSNVQVPNGAAWLTVVNTSESQYQSQMSVVFDRIGIYVPKTTPIAVDVSSELNIGRALADGTFSVRNDSRYVKRSCEGVTSIKATTGFWSTPKVVFYDASGNVVSYYNGTAGVETLSLEVPSGAVTYAINSASESTYLTQLSITEAWNIIDKVSLHDDEINGLQRSYASLVLPEWIPCVTDNSCYLYFENTITGGMLKDYTVETSTTPYYSTNDMFRRNISEAGETDITFYLYNKRQLVDSGTVTYKCVSAEESGAATVLIIGDSKSAARAPWNTLHDLLSDDSDATFTFLGTVTSGYIPREAYSGKSVINVCDDEYISGTTANIFYDADVTTTNEHHFSFAAGVTALGATPDIVFIDYGANQWSSAWSTVKGCYDDMIASIHSVDSTIKIVIVVQEGTGLLERPSHLTDGKWWLENSSYTNAQRILNEYKGRESENIFIQPSYVCMDLYRDFPICSMPTVEGATGEMEMCMDGIHPGLNADTWSSSTSYSYGDWVDRNNAGYGCKVANTNVDPATDTNHEYWSPCENLNDGYRKKGQMYYAMLKYLLT